MWDFRQFRLSPRWLVLLLGFAALVLITVASIPHHTNDAGGDHPECLLCKVGHQPLQLDTAWLPCELPSTSRSGTLPNIPSDENGGSVELNPSRAPPA